MKKLHLLCNAHLDPVWLWEWQEGAAEALSTFRIAADLCESCDSFVFNHNEVILYRWVEEYEPELFARIQGLVSQGRWHIMGGWVLQPDCNMPSGESLVRQILVGKRYFMEKFGVEPSTAINFDPFGHTRGLVQILRKSGYDSYLFGRPDQNDCPLPDSDFLWKGYDGSEVAGHRFISWYNSPLGGAREKVERFLKDQDEREVGLVLWGVGDHGGGPSEKDLRDLNDLIAEAGDVQIVHSTPERYFAEVVSQPRPTHEKDLNSWAVGCYLSQVRLKQRHRLLENEFYCLERMVATASRQGLMEYPEEALREVLWDLLVAEFHDILPGSSIQPVEEWALGILGHGLEIVSREKARAFFALAKGQPRAQAGRIPILAYNPHPFPVEGILECEFNLADFNWKEEFTQPLVFHQEFPLPCQVEQHLGNMVLDWRKRIVFRASLAPSQMNRFECTTDTVLPVKPRPELRREGAHYLFVTDEIEVAIHLFTGLMDGYKVQGVPFLKGDAFRALVLMDDADPWGMRVKRWTDVEGAFSLMSSERGSRFSGLGDLVIPSVRVVEDGPVRTVVEAVFEYKESSMVLQYKLPKQGAEVEVYVRVYWQQKDRLLKLSLPTLLSEPSYVGQVVFARDVLDGDQKECVAQKWTAVVSERDGLALTCINEGAYGSDCPDGEMRLSLVRSPSYSGHPIAERPIVPQDRFTVRIDQGERQFRFWLQGGVLQDRLENVEPEAAWHNCPPILLSFFPSGEGTIPMQGVILDDPVVQLSAFKRAEDGCGWVVRLYEPTGKARKTGMKIPCLGVSCDVVLSPFEVLTLRWDQDTGILSEVDLLERP